MEISNQSPYNDSVIINYPDGSSSLERTVPIYIRTGQEKIHTVVQDETLQDISFKYYGDSGLWYKIADVNDIIDPFNDVKVGMQLIIPKS